MTPEPMSAETVWPRFGLKSYAKKDATGELVFLVAPLPMAGAYPHNTVIGGLSESDAKKMALALNLAGPALALAESCCLEKDFDVGGKVQQYDHDAWLAFIAAREAQGERDAE